MIAKCYSMIRWKNKSEGLTTPLGKTNLNKMDKAIDTIDNEVVSIAANVESLDTTKADSDQLNNMVTDISFNDKNGVISITKYDGTVLNIDTAIEKIAVNFEYNAQTQQLIITLENGEKQYIDMSALITQYEFNGTDTIAFSIDNSGKVSASIKNGSITKVMLSSEVMAAITLSESNAAASAKSAKESATNAELDAQLSQSYSIGESGIRDGEDTDNSKYYAKEAEKYAKQASDIVGGKFIPLSEKGVAKGVAVLNDDLAVEKAVADKNGNDIFETYASKEEVPEIIEHISNNIENESDITSDKTYVGYMARNTASKKGVALMVGAGKYNRGVYDVNTGKWMVYSDASDKVRLLGDASTVNGHTIETDIPEGVGFIKTIANGGNITIPASGLVAYMFNTNIVNGLYICSVLAGNVWTDAVIHVARNSSNDTSKLISVAQGMVTISISNIYKPTTSVEIPQGNIKLSNPTGHDLSAKFYLTEIFALTSN